MALARPALAKAVQEILIRHGTQGKQMSLRQAERMTGMSPATVGELAKGNARTSETVRRFAAGLDEDVDRLLLLAGFVPDEEPPSTAADLPVKGDMRTELEPGECALLERLGQALAQMPPGRERALWRESLRHQAELAEAFLEQQRNRH